MSMVNLVTCLFSPKHLMIMLCSAIFVFRASFLHLIKNIKDPDSTYGTAKKKRPGYLVGNLVATNWPIEKALHAIGYNQIPTRIAQLVRAFLFGCSVHAVETLLNKSDVQLWMGFTCRLCVANSKGLEAGGGPRRGMKRDGVRSIYTLGMCPLEKSCIFSPENPFHPPPPPTPSPLETHPWRIVPILEVPHKMD